MGHSHGAQSKIVRKSVRVTPEQDQLIAQRAKQCKVSETVWIRSILVQAARSTPDRGYLRIREPDEATT
jgi:hypothetical protein